MRRDFIVGVAETCSVNGLFVCEGMKLAAPEMNGEGRSKGLARSFGWTPEDEEKGRRPHYLGVTYKPSKGPSLVVNFCPWCGTRIAPSQEKRSTELSEAPASEERAP